MCSKVAQIVKSSQNRKKLVAAKSSNKKSLNLVVAKNSNLKVDHYWLH